MKYRVLAFVVALSAAFIVIAGCDSEDGPADDIDESEQAVEEEPMTVGELQDRATELFEPIPRQIDDVDDGKVELGRALFHDEDLSADGTVSCHTCHVIDEGGGDNLPTSIGIDDQEGPINSPTVLNARYHHAQFWDGREPTLEDQARGPVEDELEMGNSWDVVVDDLADKEVYVRAFDELYEDGVTEDNAVDAIAEFERTLVTPDAPFDDFLRGDSEALDDRQLAGLEAFIDTGCTTCHGGKILSHDDYQKMGLVHDYFADRGTEITDADLGRYNVTGDEDDRHFFKVPTLRNVELNHPYFHDGQVETLEEAVDKMAYYQLGTELDEETTGDIVAFLESLTGDIPEVSDEPRPNL